MYGAPRTFRIWFLGAILLASLLGYGGIALANGTDRNCVGEFVSVAAKTEHPFGAGVSDEAKTFHPLGALVSAFATTCVFPE